MSVSLAEIELVSPNPAVFTASYQWRIRLDVHEELRSDCEFKVVWIGSSKASGNDQQLEDCEVGPLRVGANEFVLEHDAPDWRKLPAEDLLSVTVILIICSYQGQEFLRIAHYVNVADRSGQVHGPRDGEAAPQALRIENLCRNVLLSKPNIVRKVIDWGTQYLDDSMQSYPAQGAARGAAGGAAAPGAGDDSGHGIDGDDASRSRMDTDSRMSFTHSQEPPRKQGAADKGGEGEMSTPHAPAQGIMPPGAMTPAPAPAPFSVMPAQWSVPQPQHY